MQAKDNNKKLKKLHKLLREIKVGNESAFEEMVELINPIIIAVCYGYLKNRQDAEDAAQNTYISIVQDIHLLNEKDNAFAWIYVIARNKCLDLLRYRRRHGGKELTESLSEKFLFAEYEDKIVLKMLVNDLESEDREIVVLHYWGDLSLDEIGKVTRQSEATIRRRLQMVLEGLKKREL